MASPDPATPGTAPPNADPRGLAPMSDDTSVIVALFLILGASVALFAALHGGWSPLPWPPHSLRLRCLAAGAIGGAVGFAELVSRYRDEPWRAAATGPGIVFIALNAFASILALLLMEHFRRDIDAPDDGVARALLAGTGAMVVLRAKLFTVRQPDGTDIAVGPALAIDRLLAAVNRDIDRQRASRRHRLVTLHAERLAGYDVAEAIAFLRPAILAFQSLDPAERTALNESLATLENNAELQKQRPEVRYKYFFFDLLTTCGERTFLSIYTDLERHLRRITA